MYEYDNYNKSNEKPVKKTGFRFSSNQIMFLMLVLVLMFFGITQGFVAQEFVTRDATVHVFTGDTIKIPYEYENTYGYFTKNKSVPFVIELYSTVPDGVSKNGNEWLRDDETLNSATLGNNQKITGQLVTTVPDVEGTYKIYLTGKLKVNGTASEMWTTAGKMNVTVVAKERIGDSDNNSNNQTNTDNTTKTPNGDGTDTVTIPVILQDTLIVLIIFGGLMLICGIAYVYVKRKEMKK